MTTAKLYFYENIKKPDKRFLKYTKTKIRGKECILVEPRYEGLNIQGYWCSEEFAKELQEIRYKKEECRTTYEQELLECAYEFFQDNMDAWDEFVDIINYERFVRAIDDDFLRAFE